MMSTIERLYGTYIGGWTRFTKEHFTVFAGPRSGPLAKVEAPAWSYFADPFPWTHDGEPWLLMEEFQYFRNCGRLVARRLAGGPLTEIRLAGGGHSSFPCLFEIDGQLFLMPETGEDGTIEFYACERFPDRFRLVRHLAVDIDAADTVPVFHQDRWWLITSLRASRADGGHRSLAIFHTDDLVAGRVEPHPINAQRRFIDSAFSYGRNAGPIHRAADGSMFRPVQASRRYYGEAMQWTRIDALTPLDFHETIQTDPPFGLTVPPGLAMHHLAVSGDWLACDTRDRWPRD